MNKTIRWNPFREIADMQRQLDRVFDNGWNDIESRLDTTWMPIDVTETDGTYTVVANLPGLSTEDIDVNFWHGSKPQKVRVTLSVPILTG
jgi:HSP20 family molecular chaperone IbpA